MRWKSWKLGLVVAAITGFFTAFMTGQIFPEATNRQLVIVLLGSIGKDVVLFLVQNPAEKVQFDSYQVKRTDPSGASVTETISTETPK